MRKFLFIGLLGLISFSCTKEITQPAYPEVTPEPVNIRVRNVSGIDFTDVFVNAGSGNDFGDVASGSETGYHLFDYAYRYAFVSLVAGADTLYFQPIDYVGETPLSAGDYTYELNTVGTGNNNQLSINCIED